MRATFERLAENGRGSAADGVANRTVGRKAVASDDILMMVGAITLLMVTLGYGRDPHAGWTRWLTRIVQAIAGGKHTDEAGALYHQSALTLTLRGILNGR